MKLLHFRRTVYKVTEWRDGCVYRTQYLGTVWIEAGWLMAQPDKLAAEASIAKAAGGDKLGSMSTHTPFDETQRRLEATPEHWQKGE